MKPLRRHQVAGFSLVELMVALTIGMIILAAVSLVLVNSKKNYTTQDSLARLQENARFAMQFITRDLRMAGYYGCSHDLSSATSTVNGASGSGIFFDVTTPIQGSESKSTWQPSPGVAAPGDMKAGTDAIAIRYLDSSGAIQIDPPYMNNSSAALHTSGGGLKVGDIVMLMDCAGAATFQITGPGNPGDAITGTVDHNTGQGDPGNSTKDLGRIFEGSAKIGKFYSAQYYIANNANIQPALYRATPTGPPQELVEGIEDLQILYGVDSDGDKIPDIYKKATAMTAADWNRVVTIRFGILARTLANSNNTDKQFGTDVDTTPSYDVDGDDKDNFTFPVADNRYQRRIFRATVVLRNMQ